MKLEVKARFPEENWDDAPFPQALPLFCLPSLDGLESHTVPIASSPKFAITSKMYNNNNNNDHKQ